MKILFLTPWYPHEKNPNHGIFVRDQVRAISRHHQVRVVSATVDYSSFAFSGLNRKDGSSYGIRESRLTVNRSFPLFNQLNYFLRITWETYKIAREFKPVLVHGNIGYPGAYWSWLLSNLLKVPYVVTEHTRITNNFRSGAHRYLTLCGLKNAARLIAVSQWHADEIFSFTGQRPVVIPNVINFEKFPMVRPVPDLAEFKIGFLGNLNTNVKGLDILLHAIAGLHGNIRLHIGGKGTLLEESKALAKKLNVWDKCIFHGGISHSEVNVFMQKLHCFVSSSRSETFGIAVVEALACGVPVISTRSGGPDEFINEANGLLVPVEDSESLAAAIGEMMKNFHRYDSALIRAEVLSRFSEESFLNKIESVYSEAINAKKT